MMIRSIQIENFKSYEECHMPLAAMTFLIGPNASGKSNALEAVRLLSWLAKGSRLDDIERAIQGGDALVRGQARDLFGNADRNLAVGCHIEGVPEGWCDLRVDIGLFQDRLVIAGESVKKETENLPLYKVEGEPKPHSDEISVMYNNFKRGKNKPHIPCSNRQAIFYQLETPGRFDKKDEKSQRIIPAVTKAFRETLRQIVFLDPRPASMRDYSYAQDDEIKEDGSNLSSVLYKICSSGESQKKKLLDFVRSLPEQDITEVKFIETDRKDVMVRLVESFGNRERTVDAPLLSDGTLRVLAVAAAILTAPPGALVIIEEIDNGVHPSRADMLVNHIQAIAAERQLRVLITSHNPALLDALPDESLGDVLCCYRNPRAGDSRLVRLRDLPRFPELAAQGPLGQLMTKRILDRFLKDESTGEERQKAALTWLEQFKAGVVGQ
jgi:predicted ATPase